MREDYRFKKRKGRNIQVVFNIIPGKEISTGTNDIEEAVRFAEKYLQNFDNRRTNTALTFGEYAKGFFSEDRYGYRKRLEKKKKNRGKDYWISREGMIQNYWIPKFGYLLLSAIKSHMIDDWYMELHSFFSGKELADNTKNNILAAGSKIFDQAVRDDIIRQNPVKDIITITQEQNSRDNFNDIEMAKLYPSNEEELFKIWLTRKWICYFLIMRDTGWRPGEVAGLRRKDFYKDFNGVYTERSVNRHGEVMDRIKTTGKGKNYKIGYLSEIAVQQLEKFLQEENPDVDDLLFISTKNKGIRPETSNKHFKASCERAGVEIDNRTQYSIRHTFDTKMLELLDKETVNALMGHTSYRKEYDHRGPETLLKQYKDVRDKLG